MAKGDYKPGTAGWWLKQRGWVPIPQRRYKNGEARHPLWAIKGQQHAPIELSAAIAVEWARINNQFEERAQCKGIAISAPASGNA
jgi:hypothetical protein